MFSKACSLYKKCICYIGNDDIPKDEFNVKGMGCFFVENYIITASHVASLSRNSLRPIILSCNGYLKYDVVFDSAYCDIAILKIKKNGFDSNNNKIKEYPKIYNRDLQIGLSIGYFGNLRFLDINMRQQCEICFAQAFISFAFEADRRCRLFGLSGGIVQQGCSGGPVFNHIGEFIGIFVQHAPYIADEQHPKRTTRELPIISTLFQINDQINKYTQK